MSNSKALREAILKQAGWRELRPGKWGHPDNIVHSMDVRGGKSSQAVQSQLANTVDRYTARLVRRASILQMFCVSCGNYSKPKDANNLNCGCGGKLIEVKP